MGFFDISELQSELNPSAFSWDSVQGVIILLILIGLGICFAKKISRFFLYGFLFLVLLEILNVFAQSSLAEHIPIIQSMFQYAPLQALAQMCVGTPIASALLYVEQFIHSIFGLAFEAVVVIWKIIKPGVDFLVESFRAFGS